MKLYLGYALFFMFTISATSSHAKATIEYRVSMPMPQTHYFEVEIWLKDFKEDYVEFKLPVWTPGSYLIREYAKNVEGFSATFGSDEIPVSFHKIDKNTWRIDHKKADFVSIRYRVYSFEESVRMSYLDDSHAFIMANTLLMYVESLRGTSSVLKLDVPDQWKKVSTSLGQLEGKDYAFYVPNYDILVDSPIEIGNHESIEFVAAGVPHEVVMYGAVGFDADQIVRDLTKIIENSTAIFDENPNAKYTFFIHHADKGSGGLEHLNSCVLGVNRLAYSDTDSYSNFLSLAAHEYFHLWLVKRLKPMELVELNYDQENYTDLLWVMEGFTSYYEEKIMLRAGLYDDKKFLDNLLLAMTQIQNAPGADMQSVAEASFDTWIKYYRKNENSDNTQISYYGKGMILGALLDLSIINGSGGERSLDQVISQLYFQFYKQKGKGITSKDMKTAMENAGGIDLSDFFRDYVYGTGDLDNEKFLNFAGIKLVDLNKAVNKNSIGIKYKIEAGGIQVNYVLKNGSAFDNGINVGDELISVNGFRISGNNFISLLEQLKVGEKAVFLISRKGIVKSVELDIRKDEKVSYTYEILDNKTNSQEDVYKTWLSK